MAAGGRSFGTLRWFAVLSPLFALTGCMTHRAAVPPVVGAPGELNKVVHPPYRVEPPDILQVDLITAVPRPPYRIQPLDSLAVRVTNAPPDAPIEGVFPVDPDGTIFLGARYGSPSVRGLTVPEARTAIEQHLRKTVKDPVVDLSLAQTRAIQQVRGPHLVRQDGTLWLGTYGAVPVIGLTLPEVRQALEDHLREFFQDPQVSVDIVGYNSKVYYVIYDGGGAGQQVVRFPVTGNETVLDAVSQLSGLSAVADTRRIWVSRPHSAECPNYVLPVDWKAITEYGDGQTNYQLLPGDRLFVQAIPWVTADTQLARVLAPFERVLGFTLLGAGTIQQVRAVEENVLTGTGGVGGFATGR